MNKGIKEFLILVVGFLLLFVVLENINPREAGLFTGELYAFYAIYRYARKKRWMQRDEKEILGIQDE